MLRERFAADLKEAIKARDAARVSTLRLIIAAIKDRDIAARSEAGPDGATEVPDSEILAILSRMIRQRQESAKAYEEGGRADLAAQELAEIRVVKDYLPRPMTDEEMHAAIAKAVAATGASSIRDMGRVMAELKSRHAGRMDFAKASAVVKQTFT